MLKKLFFTGLFTALLTLVGQVHAQTWINGGNTCNIGDGNCQCPNGWSYAMAQYGNCWYGDSLPGCWTGSTCVSCGSGPTASLGIYGCFNGQSYASTGNSGGVTGASCSSNSQCVSAGSSGGGPAALGVRPTSSSDMPKK